MPRDSAGNYSLPAGNPVSSGEVISATWANTTMSDLGDAVAASLDRYGRGGMLAPFAFSDGSVTAPGAAWSNEPTSGFYRASYGDIRVTVIGTDRQRWTDTGTQLWNPTTSEWEEIVTTSGGNIPAVIVNDLTVLDSFTSPGISDNATATAITIDDTNGVSIGYTLEVVGATTLDSLTVTNGVTAATFVGDGSGLTNLPGISSVSASDITDGDMAYTGTINLDGSVTATSFTGDGSALTNLPASGIPEAPEDGKQYAREDAGWTEVVAATSLPASAITDGAMAYTGSINITGGITGTSVTSSGNVTSSGSTKARDFIETVREPRYQGGSATLELNLANNFTMNFSINPSYALGLSGTPSASGDAYGCTLTLDTTSMAALVWDSKIKWATGIAPVLAVDSTYVFTLMTTDGGTTFKGFVGGEAFA